jgi:hypothetical protein
VSATSTARYQLPLPVPIPLGATVRVTALGGVMVGRVVGVYRAPPDGWLPEGVLVQVAHGWPGVPARFPDPDVPWAGP